MRLLPEGTLVWTESCLPIRSSHLWEKWCNWKSSQWRHIRQNWTEPATSASFVLTLSFANRRAVKILTFNFPPPSIWKCNCFLLFVCLFIFSIWNAFVSFWLFARITAIKKLNNNDNNNVLSIMLKFYFICLLQC